MDFIKMRYIRKYQLILILAAVLIVDFMLYYHPLSKTHQLNRLCQNFGKNIIAQHEELYDKNSKISFFYSKRLDTCVLKETDVLGNEYFLCDIKGNYIKQEDYRVCGEIFHCDKDGVDNVILEKAEQYNGYMFNVPYSEYLDNGEGGQPRTLTTPEAPYTREKCEELFNKKLLEIR